MDKNTNWRDKYVNRTGLELLNGRLVYMPHKDPLEKAKYQAQYQRKTRLKRCEFIAQYKSRPCMDCGNVYPSCAMDFDHRPGVEKKFILATNSYKSKKVLLEEIAKCDVVCATCHRIRTYNRRMGICSNGHENI